MTALNPALAAKDFRTKVRMAPMQDEIYRVGKEALVNAFCHSGAKRIDLELEYSDSNLTMRVRDNRRGIDRRVLATRREGHWSSPECASGPLESAGYSESPVVRPRVQRFNFHLE